MYNIQDHEEIQQPAPSASLLQLNNAVKYPPAMPLLQGPFPSVGQSAPSQMNQQHIRPPLPLSPQSMGAPQVPINGLPDPPTIMAPPPPLGPVAVQPGPNMNINAKADWQLYKSSALDRIRYALERNVHSDCSFEVGPDGNTKVINSHKTILAFASPAFSNMLLGPEARDGVIRVPDVDPAAFEAMIKYIYSDQVEFHSSAEARKLCLAAKKYQLPHLISKCLEHLGTTLTAANVCELYEFGQQMEALPFEDRCLKVMQECTETILNLPHFLNLPQNILTTLLRQNTVAVNSELVLIEACLTWAKSEIDKRGLEETPHQYREVLGPALSGLRFLTLTPQQFARQVSTCGLLTVEESHSILLRLLGKKNVDVPQGVSDNTKPRTFLSSKPFVSAEQVCACPSGLGELVLLTNNDPPGRTKESRVTMRCDKDIKIIGLQIGAQVNFPMPLQAFCHTFVLQQFLSKSYLEELWVQLIVTEFRLGRLKRWTAEDIFLNKEVNYNSTIELRFREPISVKCYDLVELRISYFKEGIYPKGAWKSMAPCGIANFNFESANPNHECVLNFVSSIIFALDVQK